MNHKPVAVCYITQWYPPEPVGPSHWIPEKLATAGLEVRVLTGIPNWPTGEVAAGYQAWKPMRELVNGLRVRRTPLYPSHDSSAVRRFLNYASWALSATFFGLNDLRRSDIAIVHSSPATAALPAMAARLLFKRPYVLMIQDLWPDSIYSSGFLASKRARRVLDATVGRFVARSYAWAAHITVLSPSMKALLITRGVPADKITLVYNWIDENALAPAPADPELRESLGISPDDFVAMYAGAHGPAQGLDVLLDAMALVPTDSRIHLVMVGDGIDAPRLKARATALGLDNKVHFVGRVPQDRMPSMMAAADIQVACLKDTELFRVNMPSKIQTVLALGQPLLAVMAGDPAHVVDAAGAGWSADPNDAASVSAALQSASKQDSATMAAMGDAGRQAYFDQMASRVGAKLLSDVITRSLSEEAHEGETQ
ncbi:glycosyltransferase family 4 protein [Propioniciclava tarda]|uniref:Glycosyltransferase WbuB n=1 Tax=Propioniciclava tarda TaxID=433330 RepID=A0A4Q9KIN5_PROTD|nr:glycosyltransferase family 4 protein [Propioniciclava tarda]TBT92205.1 glycosyltransferase WbuB [Propioniciclava tarda]SMO82303.1 Glycosyltransferase involved in cell wall bisynthesis [Propioniciclava tarda]